MLIRTLLALLFLAFSGSAFADAKADIVAANQKLMEKSKFRMTGTTTSGGKTMNMWAEVDWPDRYHMRTDDVEFIILPGKTWMKQGGQWQALPMDMSAMVKSMSPEAVKQAEANMANVKEVGSETINGKSTTAYEYDTSMKMMGITATSHVKVYIDGDGYIVRQESTGEAAGQNSTTVHDYEYDESIDITAPQ